MKLQKVNRSQTKIKLAITGPAGSGKTYSSLILAFGLCGDWTKIGLIDTENSSSSLYAHLGDFNSVSLTPPFTPENYIKAIELCEKANLEVIIIDSITHCWENLLDFHSNMVGNSFTNWGKITPRHQAFVNKMLQTPIHLIATMRTKTEYVLSEKNGKFTPEKMGMKTIQRDGMDYEFTTVFDVDIKHQATVSKDRTNLFSDFISFPITKETGAKIKSWCEEGTVDTAQFEETVAERINGCMDLKSLLNLYNSIPNSKSEYAELFTKRKSEISEVPLEQVKTPHFNNEPVTSFGQMKGGLDHE